MRGKSLLLAGLVLGGVGILVHVFEDSARADGPVDGNGVKVVDTKGDVGGDARAGDTKRDTPAQADAGGDAKAGDAGNEGAAQPDSGARSVELGNSWSVTYGPTVGILRLGVTRRPDEPGATRNYQAGLTVQVPREVGFQFQANPPHRPWRLPGVPKSFQLLSFGGMLLTTFGTDGKLAERGSLSLVGTLGTFSNTLIFGIGVDMYRGIPIPSDRLDRDARATAGTGLVAWALSPQGELTPENVFFTVNIGLNDFITRIAGTSTGAP